MSVLTHVPEAMSVVFEWRTDILKSRNGLEQRTAIRQEPRRLLSLSYLADSDEEVQFWKKEMISRLDQSWQVPLWHEGVVITAAVTALDTTVSADFTKMDNEIGEWMLLLHPDGVIHQVIRVTLPRTSTTATLAVGSIDDAYPLIGTILVPLLTSYINNNSSYSPMAVNAATVQADFTSSEFPAMDGKGASALPTHRSDLTLVPTAITRYVLDVRSLSASSSEVFEQEIKRLDYGHRILLKTDQDEANITSGRQYLMIDAEDRQFWKDFLNKIKGRQKSFYTQTFRNDMTIYTQPAQGGTSFIVTDDSSPAIVWETMLSHTDLAIYTADGDTQYVTIDDALTVDNDDGTHTVEFLPALTNSPDGSNVLRVSFLELVRLASDTVEFELGATNHFVNLAIRTIEA